MLIICAFSSNTFEFDKYLMGLQLLFMKRGGQEIYVGPLGHHSQYLIEYFEVECNGPQKNITFNFKS